MQTINQMFKLYDNILDTVLNGKTLSVNGHTYSSDGINLLLDGYPIDTLNKKQKKIEIIKEKCLIARSIAAFIGEQTSDMFDEYNLIHDDLDGMALFINIESEKIVFIYMVSSHVITEQIDLKSGVMVYNYFELDIVIRHKTLSGKISSKSKEMLIKKINDSNSSITQNVFYDIVFEGMTSFIDLIQAGKYSETSDFPQDLKKLRKLY